MKTALLYLAVWLVGALISLYILLKVCARKGDFMVPDYIIIIGCAMLSWAWLCAVTVLYLCYQLETYLHRLYRTMKERVTAWWHKR